LQRITGLIAAEGVPMRGVQEALGSLALGQGFTLSHARRCSPLREGVNLRLAPQRLGINNLFSLTLPHRCWKRPYCSASPA
jgi:hypothetical protein